MLRSVGESPSEDDDGREDELTKGPLISSVREDQPVFFVFVIGPITSKLTNKTLFGANFYFIC